MDKFSSYPYIKNDNEHWNIISGEDPDYDPIFPTYFDYYNQLYKIKKNSQELDIKIAKTNQYIQKNINLIKSNLDRIFINL